MNFLFALFKDTQDMHLRHRLKRGEFWLVRVDDFGGPRIARSQSRRMADSGYLAILADNYEDNVTIGAVLLMMSPERMNDEERRLAHATWNSIPGHRRESLLWRYGFA